MVNYPRRGLAGIAFLIIVGLVSAGGAPRPVKVAIQDEKPVIVEAALPVDSMPRVRFTMQQMSARIQTEQNQQLHLSHFPMVNIDGRAMQIGQLGGRFEKLNALLPRTAGGKARQGYLSIFVIDDLRITMTAELAASKEAGAANKREMGTVLIRYSVENTGKQARRFGLKAYIDTYVVNNDGALFAAPTMPGKVLNGVELKGKTLPDYVQCLQQPDLKNPGYVAHLSLNLGSAIEKASRVVLSSHGAGGFGQWDMPVVQANGDSALAVFFDPGELKPGAKREVGYAYGKGIAVAPESEGNVELRFSGSFEPGKLFTVTAQVHDPVAGQALTLEVPKGMALVEGRVIQPVPAPIADPPQSFVTWRCRVLDLGKYALRLRSSTGVMQTKLITITRAE